MLYLYIIIIVLIAISIKKFRDKKRHQKERRITIAAIRLSKALDVEYGEKYKEKAAQNLIVNDTKPYSFNNGQ